MVEGIIGQLTLDKFFSVQQAAQTFVGDNVWNLITYSISIALYAVFIWHFYKFVARRDVFGWDTERFERSGVLGKLGHGVAYFFKYLVAYPVLTFVWFAVFSIFVFMLGSLDSLTAITVAFAIVTAIRMTSYYKEEISNEIGKLLPIVLLGAMVVQPGFLQFEPMIDKFLGLTEFLIEIGQFMLISVLIEWVLRVAHSIRASAEPRFAHGRHRHEMDKHDFVR